MAAKNMDFVDRMTLSYQPKGDCIPLGAAILDGEVVSDAKVNLALKMMNRHGLIAGATGTGKTRTLQVMAEQLSDAGVPVFMLDVKGDLSGLAELGKTNDALKKRAELVGLTFEPTSFPIELFSLSGALGLPMRMTVESFGPVLLARVLDLNDTQTGVLTAVFKYAEDQQWDLVDFNDVKKLLTYLSDGPGAAAIEEDYGKISKATAGTILRKLVAVEQQGLAHIFGEKQFEITDLFRKCDGKGVISLLNIADIQGQPLLFSTFLLGLLAQLFRNLPEVGDLDKPKLVFFFDEAHLLFKDASKAFLSQVEQIIRLIRSKGVGVFFCTQAATDIPESILGQLGNRIQHALRAFTPNDADNLRKTVRTYPISSFYKIEEVLTSLGTGQALITALNEKGVPTEVAATHLAPARSVMGPCSAETYSRLIQASELAVSYQIRVERRSAAEIVDERMRAFEQAQEQEKITTSRGKSKRTSIRQSPLEAAKSQASRTLAREGVKLLGKIASGILTAIFKKK